jgi:hypothetical protein
MTGKDAIRTALKSTEQVLGMYLGDLSDGDLLVRPVPGANHAAWQLGHLIDSEKFLLGIVPGARYPELPVGFSEQHKPDRAGSDSNKGYLSKAEYVELFSKVRSATLANLDRLSDADLDKPNTGPLAKFAPTIGDLFILISNHTLMHGGQFTPLRRKLGKPVVM